MQYILALILLLGVGLSGCASTPESRIKDNPSGYSGLPPEQQTLVRNGEVRLGMNETAVELALGKPDQITQRDDNSGSSVVWHYFDRSGGTNVSYAEVFASPRFGFFPEVVLTTPQPTGDRVRVAFSRDKVVAVERRVEK